MRMAALRYLSGLQNPNKMLALCFKKGLCKCVPPTQPAIAYISPFSEKINTAKKKTIM